MRIALRTGIQFQPQPSGNGRVNLHDPLRNRFYEVGPREAAIIREFDGLRTVAEIAGETAGGPTEGAPIVATVAQWLIQNNLATIVGSDNGARLAARTEQIREQSIVSWLNPLAIRIPLVRPDRILGPLDGVARLMFSPAGLLLWSGLLVAAAFAMVGQWQELGAGWRGMFSGTRWLWLLLAWVALKCLHELGHALACRRFGGRVGEAGLLLLLFTPLAWVDVTSSWGFPSRWHRAIVAAAGMYVELAVAAIALLVWNATPGHPLVRDICFQIVIMASVTTLLFNANPLMKFDGYFILTDLTGVSNLYTRGQQWVRDGIRALFLGWQPPLMSADEPLARWMVPAHGVLATIWRVLVTATILIAASALLHGAGTILAVAAGLAWVVLPACLSVREIVRQSRQYPIDYRRLGWTSALMTALVAGCFLLLAGPASQSAPAVIRLADEQVLRAADAGFVRQVLVDDGQRVRAGQPLVVLENRDLAFQVRDLELQIDSASVRNRRLLDQRRLAEYQTGVESQRDRELRLREARSALAEMTIRAPVDGIVLKRDLPSLCGRYLEKGDEVLTLAPTDSRRVIVSVGQEEPAAAGLGSGLTARIVFAGLPVTACPVRMFTPRADTRAPHPALCAAAGGPLPVRGQSRPADEHSGIPEYELLAPRINVELELSPEPGRHLYPGQTGRAILPAQRYSLGAWAWIQANNWMRHRIDAAFAAR